MDNNLDESNLKPSVYDESNKGLVNRLMREGIIEFRRIIYFSNEFKSLEEVPVLIEDSTDVSSIRFKTEGDDQYYVAHALNEPALRGLSIDDWEIIKRIFEGRIPERLPISHVFKWIIVKSFEELISGLDNGTYSKVKFHLLFHENIVITQNGVFKRDEELQEIFLDRGKCFDDLSKNLVDGTALNVGYFVLFYLICDGPEVEAFKSILVDPALDFYPEKRHREVNKGLAIEPYGSITHSPYSIIHIDHTEIDVFANNSKDQADESDMGEKDESLSTDLGNGVEGDVLPRPPYWAFVDHAYIDLWVQGLDDDEPEIDEEQKNITPGPT